MGSKKWTAKDYEARNEHLERLRLRHLGSKNSQETIEKRRRSLTGKRHSEEAKQKMREYRLGRKATPETREKLSKIQKVLRTAFKGGRTKHSAGYIEILMPGHQYAHNGYVLEHRIVMERHIGRVLTPLEVVHHINGDKADNRLENLKLFANNQEHMKHHWELEHNDKNK